MFSLSISPSLSWIQLRKKAFPQISASWWPLKLENISPVPIKRCFSFLDWEQSCTFGLGRKLQLKASWFSSCFAETLKHFTSQFASFNSVYWHISDDSGYRVERLSLALKHTLSTTTQDKGYLPFSFQTCIRQPYSRKNMDFLLDTRMIAFFRWNIFSISFNLGGWFTCVIPDT